MSANKNKKQWKKLTFRRKRIDDMQEQINYAGKFIIQAIYKLWEDETVPAFKDENYRKFIAIELMKGRSYPRCDRIKSIETAIPEIIAVHERLYDRYMNAPRKADDIDRRMIQPKEVRRTVKERGVNFITYGDEH